MIKKKILVTSTNGPIALELVLFLKKKFYVIGCDCQPYGLGKKICDEFYISPKGNSKKFLTFITKISKKVDQIFLFADEELINVSKNFDVISKLKSKILISPYKTVEICNDKNKMKKYFHNTSFIPSKIGKKIIIKPRIGRGSKNQIVVDDKSNIFFNFFSKNKDFTIEKYNEGKEYSIDCIFDKNFELVFALPRMRIIKSNISVVGKIVKNSKLIKFVKKLSKELKFVGNVNIQVFMNKNKNIQLTDINPRVSGSIIFSIMAGFDPFLMAYSINYNKSIKRPNKIKYGKIFYRYWKTFD